MSFGSSAGDLFIVGKLALDVYKKCRDCPGEYRNLAGETRTLANTLQDLEDLARSKRLDASNQRKLLERGEGCKEVLTDLNALLQKYSSLSTQSKRTWDRLNWDQQGGRDIRARLTSQVTMLTAFYNSLIHSSQLRIEEALHQLVTDIQRGHREATSVISLTTAGQQQDEDDDAAWPQIVRDLEDLGISKAMAIENRTFIVEWFIGAINEGMLQEIAPEDEGETAPASLSTQPLTISTPKATNGAPQPELAQPVVHEKSEVLTHTTRPGPPTHEVLITSHKPGIHPAENTAAIETIECIVDHWNARRWDDAEKGLKQQLEAIRVKRGTTTLKGPYEPNVRTLEFLLGICSSFQGDFLRAKPLFESVVQGSFISDASLDEGDIAAALWLGDTCLQLNEPISAGLAWTVAYNGLITKYGKGDYYQDKVFLEHAASMRYLDLRTRALHSLTKFDIIDPIDPSNIFHATSMIVKSRLVQSTLASLSDVPKKDMEGRSAADIRITKDYLIHESTTRGQWPLQYDPFFRVSDTVSFVLALRPYTSVNLAYQLSSIPTTGLGQSKSLAYVSNKGPEWLLDALRSALSLHSIRYRERSDCILCLLRQTQDHIAYHELIPIALRKVTLQSVWGIKVEISLGRTRQVRPSNVEREILARNELVKCLREYLRQAEESYNDSDRRTSKTHSKGVTKPSVTGLGKLLRRQRKASTEETVKAASPAELEGTGLAELEPAGVAELETAGRTELP